MRFLIVTLCSSLQLGCSVFGIQSEEGPQYEVVRADKNKEIRRYQPHLVAQTTVDGSFDEAQNKGFRILADYIFGKNKSQQKIAMTSPVVQKPKETSEKIEMTPKKYLGVIRFTGLWSEKKNSAQANLLKEWLSSQMDYEIMSEAQFAGYNPPWTIPWFRRNEMMIELKKKN